VELRVAENTVQILELDRRRARENFSGERRDPELRQLRLQEALDLREVLGARAEVEPRFALGRVHGSVGVQPRAEKLEVERERPGLARLLEQARRAARHLGRVAERVVDAAADLELQRLVPAAVGAHLVEGEDVAGVRARVHVLDREPVERDAIDLDRRLGQCRLGARCGGTFARGPVRAAVRGALEAHAAVGRLEAQYVQLAAQRREQVDACARVAERGELLGGEAGRVQDAHAADAKPRFAAEHQLERPFERHRPPQGRGGPRGDRVAPARHVDRHVEQDEHGGRAEDRRDRQADQRRGKCGDQSPARHRATRARVAIASR
jgi:hypothetical protein